MPPALHPRSRMTSSLFATTVVASFFVVALPHVLPCPVPKARFADGEISVDENGRRRVWRRKDGPEVRDGIAQFDDTTAEDVERAEERVRRECPLPKPGGMLGEWLGFHKSAEEEAAGQWLGALCAASHVAGRRPGFRYEKTTKFPTTNTMVDGQEGLVISELWHLDYISDSYIAADLT
ncbi:hypothetical protein G7046_g846 [Stylonectria norvegica]|nr:hypothetical protein G7046_g846 [Stylonectria norvegica]